MRLMQFFVPPTLSILLTPFFGYKELGATFLRHFYDRPIDDLIASVCIVIATLVALGLMHVFVHDETAGPELVTLVLFIPAAAGYIYTKSLLKATYWESGIDLQYDLDLVNHMLLIGGLSFLIASLPAWYILRPRRHSS